MANLDWGQVLWIAGAVTLAFTLLSYWFSGVMARKGWSWQVRSKAKRRREQP